MTFSVVKIGKIWHKGKFWVKVLRLKCLVIRLKVKVGFNDDKNAQSAFTRLRITKFHFVILGGVSANEVNFFAFGLHENSGFKILMEHEGTKTQSL